MREVKKWTNDNLLEEYTQNAREASAYGRQDFTQVQRGVYRKRIMMILPWHNEVFTGALRRFDGTQSFEGFYMPAFQQNQDRILRRETGKRGKTDTQSVSLDTPVGDGESVLGDMLESDFDMEAEPEKRNRTYRIHG